MKTILGSTATLCLVLLFSGCSLPGNTRDAENALRRESIIRAAWLNLPKSKSVCEEYDYFPGGGMRNMYCHLLNFTTWQEVQLLAEVPVFISGPHTATHLDLNNQREFGHYNPEFISRLTQVVLSGINDKEFLSRTRYTYSACLLPLARTFLITRYKMRITTYWTQREIEAWQHNMDRPKPKRWFYERYYDYLEPPEDGEYSPQNYLGDFDGNVVKTCVGFWIRREIDGTAAEFEKALTILLETYDRQFLVQAKQAYRM